MRARPAAYATRPILSVPLAVFTPVHPSILPPKFKNSNDSLKYKITISFSTFSYPGRLGLIRNQWRRLPPPCSLVHGCTQLYFTLPYPVHLPFQPYVAMRELRTPRPPGLWAPRPSTVMLPYLLLFLPVTVWLSLPLSLSLVFFGYVYSFVFASSLCWSMLNAPCSPRGLNGDGWLPFRRLPRVLKQSRRPPPSQPAGKISGFFGSLATRWLILI